MVKEIMDAIADKLGTEFGEGYGIYTKNEPASFTKPCFYIAVLQPERKPLLGNRLFLKVPFDIQYFPRDSKDNNEMIIVAEQMMDVLEIITCTGGGSIRGTTQKYEIVDGVLHFFIQFNMHLIKTVTQDSMETLQVETGTMKG